MDLKVNKVMAPGKIYRKQNMSSFLFLFILIKQNKSFYYHLNFVIPEGGHKNFDNTAGGITKNLSKLFKFPEQSPPPPPVPLPGKLRLHLEEMMELV